MRAQEPRSGGNRPSRLFGRAVGGLDGRPVERSWQRRIPQTCADRGRAGPRGARGQPGCSAGARHGSGLASELGRWPVSAFRPRRCGRCRRSAWLLRRLGGQANRSSGDRRGARRLHRTYVRMEAAATIRLVSGPFDGVEVDDTPALRSSGCTETCTIRSVRSARAASRTPTMAAYVVMPGRLEAVHGIA